MSNFKNIFREVNHSTLITNHPSFTSNPHSLGLSTEPPIPELYISNCIHHLQLPIFRSIQYPTIPYSSIQSSITSIYPFFRSIQYPTIQQLYPIIHHLYLSILQVYPVSYHTTSTLQYIQSFITSNYHSSGLYSIVPSHICSSIQSSITSNPHS